MRELRVFVRVAWNGVMVERVGAPAPSGEEAEGDSEEAGVMESDEEAEPVAVGQ